MELYEISTLVIDAGHLVIFPVSALLSAIRSCKLSGNSLGKSPVIEFELKYKRIKLLGIEDALIVPPRALLFQIMEVTDAPLHVTPAEVQQSCLIVFNFVGLISIPKPTAK
eukprot:NODE_190_length_13461_cov_0.525595.p12 type:complete len:111 gc:universal NODE_190_length_13461_cov_0.525595:826-494(-)